MGAVFSFVLPLHFDKKKPAVQCDWSRNCYFSLCGILHCLNRTRLRNNLMWIFQNLKKALETRGRVLRLIVQHKGETLEEQFGYGVSPEALTRKKRKISISAPQDFRRASFSHSLSLFFTTSPEIIRGFGTVPNV